jgi:hypothetical protein
MGTIREIIQELMDRVKEDLITDHQAKNQPATGRLEGSFRSDVRDFEGDLYAASYFRYLVTGRGPGKFPPKDNILEWIDAKPISFEGITRESLAYLIGRKISEEGTRIFSGEAPGLDFEDIVEFRVAEFNDRIRNFIKEDAQDKIKTAINA